MQLARLRFHLQTRTPTGKFIQIVRALELERHYSKSEILEAYLNLAPYGRNIEGIGAASEIYFGKTAAHLTRPESISLSVIPQSPTRRALYAGRENRSLNAAQDNWYDRAKVNMQLSARQFSARAETERKFLAPHFVQQVLATEKGRDGIVTTLDLKKQELIERRMADYITIAEFKMPPRYLSMSERWMCWRKLVRPISSTPKFRDKWTERGVRARPVPLSNRSSTRSHSTKG
jgi:penicillin-binding protein 1C